MAIEQTLNNMMPLLDGFWLDNNDYVHAEFTQHRDGTRSIALSEPVPYTTLPRPKQIAVYGCTHMDVPAFGGTLLYGMLEDNGLYYGFFLLIADGRALLTASFRDLPPIQKAEVHGTHLLLHTMCGETLRVIPSEDCTSVMAEMI